MNTNRKQGFPFKLPTSEYPEFSQRLRYAMTLRSCTVTDLAQALYVSKSTICGYRKGTRNPDLPTLRLICQRLRVSSDFLLGLQEDIYL